VVTRRAILAAAAASAGCGRRKGRRFNGYAFIANEAGRSVAAIDLADFVVVKRIALPGEPSDITSAGTRVFILVPPDGSVTELDALTGAVKKVARVARKGFAMRLTPDGEALWIACVDPPSLVRVDLASMSVRSRLRLDAPPRAFDLARNATHAAVIADGVSVMDLANGAKHSLKVAADPRLVRFRFDWEPRQILVGDASERAIVVADLKTGRPVVRLPLPVEPVHTCVTRDGGQLFVSGPGMDAVVVVFPFTTEIGETLLAGNAPGAMAISAAPEYLFVANPTEGRITILDIVSRKLVGIVSVGQEPGSILFTPDRQYALVLNRKSGDVAVIRMDLIRGQRNKTAPLFTMIPVGSRPVGGTIVTA
jgi:DNA-binding beta-propeller fold protein YncE